MINTVSTELSTDENALNLLITPPSFYTFPLRKSLEYQLRCGQWSGLKSKSQGSQLEEVSELIGSPLPTKQRVRLGLRGHTAPLTSA